MPARARSLFVCARLCSLCVVCVLRFTPRASKGDSPGRVHPHTGPWGWPARSAARPRPARGAFMAAAANCKAAVGLLRRSLSLSPAQKPSGNQRSLLGVNWLQERGLRESREAHKCIPLPAAASAARFHPVTFLCQDSMRDSLKVCYKYLNETSRSFAAVIQALDGELRHAVCIFYLVLRALDTVEDDMTIGLEAKIPMLHDFHTYLYEPDWRFMESKEKDKRVLEDFPTISLEFRNLEKEYQVVISDICHKMGIGMAEFLEKKVDSLQEWDKYCHYVAGLVGIGLSRLFSASELEDPIVGQDTQLSNSMGLFLQKTNIIRDYLEDELEGREFWPREVWSKYSKKLSDLAKPENIDLAMHCMNELITNALQHVPDVLTYLARLKNQSVFNFCAIPQVMAIATLAACYNNQQVFRGVVKIRKGQAVTLMMDATNLQAVKAMMYQYVEEIYQKIPTTDPSCKKTQQIIISIRTHSLPSGALVSRNHFSPVYLSCAMLLAALSWQYLTSVSHASDEFVQATEN